MKTAGQLGSMADDFIHLSVTAAGVLDDRAIPYPPGSFQPAAAATVFPHNSPSWTASFQDKDIMASPACQVHFPTQVVDLCPFALPEMLLRSGAGDASIRSMLKRRSPSKR